MISNQVLNFFRLRVSGDEGDDESGTPPVDTNEDGNGDDKGSGNPNDQGTKKFEVSGLPEEAQKMLKDLRAENAKHRTTNNNLTSKMEKFESGLKNMFGDGEDDEDPSAKLEALQGNYESAVTRSAILELALENGISGKENLEYFEFLMGKSLNSLEEGEELTEEKISDIVSKSVPTKGSANTSTKKDGAGDKKPDESSDEVTQEQFNKMGMTQKSLLYRTKPELYKQLMAGANL